MEPFVRFRAIGIPVDVVNCDTDQIIPARFLRYPLGHEGYARFLFHDLRYGADGAERPDFILNRAPYRDGRIIVADLNWGCGSSRESAVHALLANGIRAVIAPSFGEIHHGNCMKRGVLPVRLPRAACAALRAQLHAAPGAEIEVDLEARTVTGPEGAAHSFDIAEFDRRRMLRGLDDHDLVMEHERDLELFEAGHRRDQPWLYAN